MYFYLFAQLFSNQRRVRLFDMDAEDEGEDDDEEDESRLEDTSMVVAEDQENSETDWWPPPPTLESHLYHSCEDVWQPNFSLWTCLGHGCMMGHE